MVDTNPPFDPLNPSHRNSGIALQQGMTPEMHQLIQAQEAQRQQLAAQQGIPNPSGIPSAAPGDAVPTPGLEEALKTVSKPTALQTTVEMQSAGLDFDIIKELVTWHEIWYVAFSFMLHGRMVWMVDWCEQQGNGTKMPTTGRWIFKKYRYNSPGVCCVCGKGAHKDSPGPIEIHHAKKGPLTINYGGYCKDCNKNVHRRNLWYTAKSKIEHSMKPYYRRAWYFRLFKRWEKLRDPRTIAIGMVYTRPRLKHPIDYLETRNKEHLKELMQAQWRIIDQSI